MNNHASHRHAHTHAVFNTQSVPWKDLVKHQRFETARELCLPLPWFLAAVICGQQASAVGVTGFA